MRYPWTAIVALFFLSTVACESCEYEKFTPDHSACKPMNETCELVNNLVKDEDIALIVKLLNQYRNEIAMGKETPENGPRKEIVPSASNMMEVQWDDELAHVARMHAQTCNPEHDCDECRRVDRFDVVGQTIYEASSSGTWEEMMKELRQTSYSDNSQLIWADTWKVGCGKVEYGLLEQRKSLIVCNYAPGANSDVPPFKPGIPCSECPSRTCCGHFCSEGAGSDSPYQALCKLEKCKYGIFTPNHVGCKLRNPDCNIVDDLVTEDEQYLILKLHNDYREKIAMRYETTEASDLQESATNMRQMVWDDELAYLAQRHAETCNTEFDCDVCREIDRFSYVGQRIYESSSSDDESSSLNVTSELEKMLNPDYLNDTQVAQLLWADTWRIGCGKVVYEKDGNSKIMIICYYAPSANPKVIIHENIYNIGSPCTECPAGTCCGENCNLFGVSADYEGLCKSNLVDTPGFDIELRRCKYVKFTLEHDGCKPRNLGCKILNNYVSDEDKAVILKIFNEHRDMVAMERDIYYSLPAAANMKEMEWDYELAMLAQRHAETCNPEYDCYECRKTDRFNVHQMIYTSDSNEFPEVWGSMMKEFLRDENHFLTVIWADTWRVGCGKVEFENASDTQTLIVCNFGPDELFEWKENIAPYIVGPACTACEGETCCGDACDELGVESNYQGLCKATSDNLLEPDEEPESGSTWEPEEEIQPDEDLN